MLTYESIDWPQRVCSALPASGCRVSLDLLHTVLMIQPNPSRIGVCTIHWSDDDLNGWRLGTGLAPRVRSPHGELSDLASDALDQDI